MSFCTGRYLKFSRLTVLTDIRNKYFKNISPSCNSSTIPIFVMSILATVRNENNGRDN